LIWEAGVQRSASADHHNFVVDPSSSIEDPEFKAQAAGNQRVRLGQNGAGGVPSCVGEGVPMADQRPGGRGYRLVQDLRQEGEEQEVNVDEPWHVG